MTEAERERAAIVEWLRAYSRNAWSKRGWRVWRWWAHWAGSVVLDIAADLISEKRHHKEDSKHG